MFVVSTAHGRSRELLTPLAWFEGDRKQTRRFEKLPAQYMADRGSRKVDVVPKEELALSSSHMDDLEHGEFWDVLGGVLASWMKHKLHHFLH